MRCLCIFGDFNNFINQLLRLLCILVFLARIENKANSFKRLDLLFGFESIAAEQRGGKRHFLKILLEDIVIFVVVNQQINYFGPVLQSFAAANEKILFIEYVQYLMFEFLEEDRFLL